MGRDGICGKEGVGAAVPLETSDTASLGFGSGLVPKDGKGAFADSRLSVEESVFGSEREMVLVCESPPFDTPCAFSGCGETRLLETAMIADKTKTAPTKVTIYLKLFFFIVLSLLHKIMDKTILFNL